MSSDLTALQKLDNRSLKIIAVISMLIDHIGAALFPELIALRYIGRLAFPIYCFLLVEGAAYTHDIRKYMIRLGAFALISEIPFDLAINGQAVYFGGQNVFFTLLIGLVMIWFLEHSMRDIEVPDIIYKILVLAVAGILAELLQTDYGLSGIVIIFIFYVLRPYLLPKLIAVGLICIGMGRIESFAIIALVLLTFYNGQRGFQPKWMQYGFYAFYPVHLLILGVIAQFMS